jgi:hypothetical protein
LANRRRRELTSRVTGKHALVMSEEAVMRESAAGMRAILVGAVVVVGVLLVSAGRSDSAPKRDADGQALESIEKRLESIEASQQAMMKTLDTILEELRIIKVRATR